MLNLAYCSSNSSFSLDQFIQESLNKIVLLDDWIIMCQYNLNFLLFGS